MTTPSTLSQRHNPGRYRLLCAVIGVCLAGSQVRGQDSDEVKRLKDRIELLELKLERAEKDNERLRKELAQAKTKEPQRDAKKSLSELLSEGRVLSGNYRASTGKDKGTLTFTIKVRDGQKIKGTSVLKSELTNKTVEGTFEGEINGVRLDIKGVGSAVKVNVIVSLKGENLEGTWATSVGSKGTVGLTLSK